jgi:hypothetical protein
LNQELKIAPRPRDAVVTACMSLWSRPALLAMVLGFFVLLPWCLALLEMVLPNGPHDGGKLLLLGAVSPLVFFVGIPLLNYRLAKQGPAFGDAVVRITDDGVTVLGKAHQTEVSWSLITRCQAWRGNLLLLSGPVAALSLPARSLTPELRDWIVSRVNA